MIVLLSRIHMVLLRDRPQSEVVACDLILEISKKKNLNSINDLKLKVLFQLIMVYASGLRKTSTDSI